MKTTKRSKMLISSIAMLLVALVALGSATYAWYTLNKQVTASSVTVNASAPTGLMISTSSSTGWGPSITWEDDQELVPASLNFKANIATTDTATDLVTSAVEAKATGQSAYGAAAVTDADSNAYIAKTFYVKSTGDTPLTDVTATLTATATDLDGTYVNAVLFDVTEQKALAMIYSDGTMHGYLNTSGVETAFAGSYVAANWAEATDTSAAATEYAKDTPHTIVLIVYVDGQNTNCTTNAYDQTDVVIGVTFDTNLNEAP